MHSIAPAWLWLVFSVFVLATLALDLGVFHRKEHAVKTKEALLWSAAWISLALVFNGLVYKMFGGERALQFLTGYLVEKALSVDNIFVMLVVLTYFKVPAQLQHRVLFWGILGALIMRAIFIFLGGALLQQFHWVMYIFGVVLLVTGFKLLLQRTDEEVKPERNPIFRRFRRIVPAVGEYHGGHFTIVRDHKRYATLLLVVLVSVEATDITFAVDSIPAIFAITQDPFIVYTSNIFAVLGLRALYFLLAGIIDKFHYLKVGLALILMFVGVKMVAADYLQIPIGISLAVIASLLICAVTASLLWPARDRA